MKRYESYTLEENLLATNDELTSNWIKLASLVKSYENIHYDEAKAKARGLLAEGTAIEYIEKIRKNHEIKPEVEQPKPVTPALKPKPTNQTIEQTNYERLLRIAPRLEEKLMNAKLNKGTEVYGKSESTGYMDFSLELIDHDEKSFYIAIAHYHIQNGDMMPDPDMMIRVDVVKKKCEALTFQDANGFKKVYVDYMDRKLVNTKEKKAQNSFLGTWLRNLKTQGHKIKWREPETTGVLKSELIIEYEKPAPEKSKKTAEPETVKKAEQIKTVPSPDVPKYSVFTPSEMQEIVSAIMYYNSKTALSEAEQKAEEYRNEGTVPNFLLKVYTHLQSKVSGHLHRLNYYKMLQLNAEIFKRLKDADQTVKLSSAKVKKLPEYEIARREVQSEVIQYVIHEYSDSDVVGVAVIILELRTKRIIVEELAQGFADHEDYRKFDGSFEERQKVDNWYSEWLDKLIDSGYKLVWKNEVNTEETTPEILPEEPKAPAEPSADDQLAEAKKRAREIPDFAPGNVQLVEAHVKAGLTQKDIDWINEHKQGMVITPRRKPMVNNTKSKEMDKLVQAMKPGFRISATGKMYYEGRSNRSDKRSTGL